MTILESLKANKSHMFILGIKKTIKLAESQLSPNEEVINAITGKILFSNGPAIGVIVLTSKRVFAVEKTLWEQQIKSVDLSKIESIEQSKDFLYNYLHLKSLTETLIFGDLEDNLLKMKQLIEDLINTSHGSTPPRQTLKQQLEELKSLLDSNLITQEEFEAKKKQILGL